jgi:hypothetical protein
VGEAIGVGGDQLIIERRTGKLLGYRDVVDASDTAARNLPVGTVFEQTAIIARIVSVTVSAPRAGR